MMKALVTALYKAALSKASHVFFENAENRNIFLSLGIIPENITTILNGAGVNTNYYSFQTYPDPESVPIKFLFIGRIMAEKGINELFEAARRIKAEKINAEVNIAGYFDDDYKKQTEALCDEGIIRYLGFHDDVRPLLKETHCFILPSYHEGMANTVLEAASSGRPLIVSDISGCREAVENGENGLLIEPHSVESLFSAMKSFAELSNDIRISMGEESRRIAVNKFDKNKVVDMVMEVIGL
ncbi:N,N'-diacetylbacillosaminyl-diphospho-undecaprenol alpha-1,3-N-acetylgalactosaminyltransferase [bioreactor metagenome]|uniref:N, N'-diacetylbacillosaminyl-diphospho-undecaprenol alpha-1,3-N-acetylgalactosaminyltransferase n=1 Tax=bioreactor metagenome TaxID=1076179 RepID=A0A645C0U2_9ZZZZ